MTDTTPRRTKRRYAHELYPDPSDAFEAAPLAQEVPHLYARALGLNTLDTGWTDVEPAAHMARVNDCVNARMIAALADAMAQDLVGQEAYAWAYGIASDETGECTWDRALIYGVDPYAIKPYPLGDERSTHYHYDAPDRHGTRIGRGVPGRESECEACTEPVED